MKNKIIPYNPELKVYARQLRKNSSLAEVLLWQQIKKRSLGVQFHRQVPMLEYIVDFYCHEIHLAIEIDGDSHEYQYDNDSNRQEVLEKEGVLFIRFSDVDVKRDMFSVGLALEEKVRELLEIRVPKNTPLTPHSREESGQEASLEYCRDQEKSSGMDENETFDKTGPTPLKSPQGAALSLPKWDNSYGKKEKLKSRKLIEKLFTKGQSISRYPIKLIYLQSELPENVQIQAGVAVPKKTFKSAVKRNRIKRLLREGYRLNKHLLFNNSDNQYAFLFLYIGKEMPNYPQVEKVMKEVLGKFLKTEAFGKENKD